MAYQERSIRDSSNSCQNLSRRYWLSSYLNNQSYFSVSTSHVLVEEIDPPSSSEDKVVDATHMHVDTHAHPNSTAVTTCMEVNDFDSPVMLCSSSALTKNASHDHSYPAIVEGNNEPITIDIFEGEALSTGVRLLSSSEVQRWERCLIQLSKRLAYSPMILSSGEYLSMSTVQVSQALAFLNTCVLKEVNLTLPYSTHSFLPNPAFKGKRRFHRKKIMYVLREDIVNQVLPEFSVVPLDKAKSQYIAIDQVNLDQRQCHGHPEEVHHYYNFNGYYIYTVCNIDLATHLVNCQMVEHHAEVGPGLTEAVHPSWSNSEHQKNSIEIGVPYDKKPPGPDFQRPLDQSEFEAESECAGRSTRRTKNPIQRAEKFTLGPEKSICGTEISKYAVAVMESHRGPSVLQLPKEWNAFSVLLKSTQLRVLCLESREVTIGARQLLSSSNQQNQRSGVDSASHQQIHVNHASSDSRVQLTRRPPRDDTHSALHMRSAVHTDVRVHQSHVRGSEASTENGCEIRVVDLSFSAREITQLLHASHYDEIIQQLQDIPSNLPPESLIPTHFIIGVAYFKTSKYKKAKEHFKKCASLAEETRRDGDVMLCNAYLGDMEYASQSYLEAAEYYKKAVRHYAPGSVALMFKLTPPSVSAIHAKLASAYRNVSMMVQAIQRYQTAISKATTDRDKLSAHTSLGNLYQSMGDNSNALNEYKESIKLAEILSDHVSLGWAHGNIGNAYLGLNRKDEALHNLHKSLDLAVEYEQTPQAIGRTYNNLGTAYQSMNDLDKAEEYYDLALSQAIFGNDTAGQARVYGNIGNIRMLRKNYEQAIPHYGEVLLLSKDSSTVSTAQHNRGCAYYDWATSLQQSHRRDDTLKIHGPDCDIDICLSNLPLKSKEYYQKGARDLEDVVKYHEERLQHVKGSPNGLTLSVSLFESNSRTFHRLQDCLYNLHMFDKALLVAEQSRARTLGELLLKRKGEDSLKPPLKFDQVTDIVKNLSSPLIYFSYTGERLICWLFLSNSGKLTMRTFDRRLSDDQFDGKSFDYYLRYSLTEKLVERSFEMYQHIKYDSESSAEVQTLYNLVGEPIQGILLGHSIVSSGFMQVTSISDSYTALLPLTCLQDPKSISFFGDHYYFNLVPSLLTLGIMNQTDDVTVNLEDAKSDFCVVGDPNIPPFNFNDELWYLGKLPYAKREAEWVAHALQTSPVLNEHATKSALLIRLQRAKLVHIATHGSASAGFLAFAAFALHTNDRKGNTVDASNVLLFPKEIEMLRISSALVVLSSCDSGRGAVKADGIQGMARAFILAGAQSVLTTLWKVPDESASVFMQFFYQYLIKGVLSSLALQKAILSVRCFTKYSQYIHWSGYQLTGRDTLFLNTPKPLSVVVQSRLDKPSVFPRLSVVKQLEKLVKDPTLPTDVQILKGCPSVNPSEAAKDFILSSYTHFSGGIFWISCHQSEMIQTSIEYIQKIMGTEIINMVIDEKHQVLFVLDSIVELPTDESLLRILQNRHVHIIAVNTSLDNKSLIREIDRKLVRGCAIHKIEPLTVIHSTQRMVFNVIENYDFTPTNIDQSVFEQLAELSLGSPLIIDTIVQLLLDYLDSMGTEGIQCLGRKLQVEGSPAEKSDSNSTRDLLDSMKKLISCCELSCEEQLLLNSLSSFAGGPVPMSLVTEISRLITHASHQTHLAGNLHQKLTSHKLLLQYPLPTIVHPVLLKNPTIELVYVPQHMVQYLWKYSMDRTDKAFALTVAYQATCQLLSTSESTFKSNFIRGACSLLNETFEVNYEVIGKDCYQQMLSLYFTTKFNDILHE